ncbi:MAG: glycosyltransferase [Parcubacteria group bacterium]|nr:glycosyltransferase [Parcubacteria group bacterium]
MKKLSIALVTPYEHTAPPPPSVIRAPQELWARLADELVARGHRVVLFAPQGSKTKASKPSKNLPPLSKNPEYQRVYRTDKTMAVVKLYKATYNEIAYARFADSFQLFDLVHAVFAPEFLPIASRDAQTPVLFTFHDPIVEHKALALAHYARTRHLYFNSISRAQQSLFPSFRYDGVVYNGMELTGHPFYARGGPSLFFAGRMRKIKGPHIAVHIAKKLGLPLKLAGESYPDEAAFWNREIAPRLSKKIQFIGMQPRKKMPELYGNAKVTLMPISLSESFGLVMTESMAAGTPVVAFDCGSPLEIIKHGTTGFVVKNESEMIAAVKRIYAMPPDEYLTMRRACRAHVEKNFSIERMAENYESLYYSIIK